MLNEGVGNDNAPSVWSAQGELESLYMDICKQMAKCFNGYLMQGMAGISRMCMLNVVVRRSWQVLALLIGGVEKARKCRIFLVFRTTSNLGLFGKAIPWRNRLL
ncbi:hypothetical protein GOP47_0021305 [Adiantum capillus-veneris]|uniref:Uncharacterized protein n=1 Tax=Adiantum capillus-veneris TaxID=13818 RepID=A0A9D4UBC7_ADICA|nr:hypothetical protein GOP47_0021305 [Adiantum capillus-veneris]